ncbi:MAG: hypothetical protein LYZ70_00615 [Nitrososphaerales archaeon]|nr:hypothetical protein [Nitrososphaerales archaeon]
MLADVTWVGIDFAFTIMNPLTMHHSKVIPEMYKRLGRPEEGQMRLALWYKLRDNTGSPTDAPHQKVRLMKEYNRERLNAEVFGNDPKAIEMYAELECTERRPPDGMKEALLGLKERRKTLAVVSEVSSVSGAQNVAHYLDVHGVGGLFDEIITPAGRLAMDGAMLDDKTFEGSNKKEGTIYARLAAYLDSKGVSAGRRAMVGDDPNLDVTASKRHGFVGVYYTGVVDRGKSEQADLVISDWRQLRTAM